MHEMALCEGILQAIEENSKREGYRRVKLVRLEIGALAGVEIDAMRFGFDAVMQGTLADGAALDIVNTPGQAWCLDCAHQVAVTQRFDECPDCGGFQLEVTAGDEMRIKELQVE
ncbi:MAG: hydrogenase maturation nickel metallochaperone HypA [Proteobacteria bacterium]|nr:MAG: hydrogenase maturation nickel metallochaperone HypA [Pseudomonadota bacterium]